MINENNLELLKELSLNNPKKLSDIIIKLSEENGEVSEAYLSMNNVNGSGYKEKNSNDLLEELLDVIMVASSAIYKMNVTDKEINEIFERKLNKWKEKSINSNPEVVTHISPKNRYASIKFHNTSWNGIKFVFSFKNDIDDFKSKYLEYTNNNMCKDSLEDNKYFMIHEMISLSKEDDVSITISTLDKSFNITTNGINITNKDIDELIDKLK